MIQKTSLSMLCGLVFLLVLSCNSNDASVDAQAKVALVNQPISAKTSEQASEPPHPYGGWSCPDNILGFPAVDIKKIDQVPVITGRLPTKEETQESKSLIYIDTKVYPSAKPLDIKLPALARYYSEFTKKNELIVVIQAVTIGQDSIVGFRFLNGGNGSARLKEVTFVSEEEQAGFSSTPFVVDGVIIDAFPKIIWDVITNPEYAKTLGAMFGENAYLESTWEKNAEVNLKYGPDKTVTTGIITAIWKDLYIQIDYNLDGHHQVKKILLLKNKEAKNTNVQITTGPFGADYVVQKLTWSNWLNKVKELSERKMNMENYFGIGDQFWE